MSIVFETLSSGIEIIDSIDRCRDQILTPNAVSITDGEKDNIPYPLDAAVQITTDKLTIPENGGLYLGDCSGNYIDQVSVGELLDLDNKRHVIDFSDGIKLYLYFNSSAKVYSDYEYYYVSFPNPTQVTIGGRSQHIHPANTIKVTDNPTDIMKAVSMLGSSLKTLTVNKSFPTLRGHPPKIQIDTESYIPDEIEPPKSGIQIEVPPRLHHIFVVSPLAYYLGAEVVPGPVPLISTDQDWNYTIGKKGNLEESVQKLLKQIFFFDCIVRTEGWGPSVQELDAINKLIDTSVSELYGLRTNERIKKCLEIPFDLVEEHIPIWPVQTDIQTIPQNVELLPFIVSDLSVVNTYDNTDDKNIIDTNLADEIEQPTAIQRWNGISDNDVVSSTSRSAFQHGLDRSPRTGPIDIEIVCNDPNMNREFVNAYSTYGSHDPVPFDVTLHSDLTTNELENVLTQECDFFHYIGHIETDGFQCADGKVDAATIEAVNAKAFFLNACQSHGQGLHLVKSGSLGGIVTAAAVENKSAVSIGSTVAKLLNFGFPLYGAVDLARIQTTTAEQYHIVGDGKTVVSKGGSTTIPSSHVLSLNNGDIEIKHIDYLWKNSIIGGSHEPMDKSDRGHHIIPGNRLPVNISPDEFFKDFGQDHVPMILDGELVWSDKIKTTDLM